jgi:hypothetical protein
MWIPIFFHYLVCPFNRRLYEVAEILGDDIWHLTEVDPARAPTLDRIIMEYSPSYTFFVLESLRPAFEEKLPGFVDARVKAGADPVKEVVLRSASEWDFPQVRDIPQSCGVLLRLEATNPGDQPLRCEMV